MNIFFLDRDPAICASYHCDKHVVKMATEYAQILSTAVRLKYGQPGNLPKGDKSIRYQWCLPGESAVCRHDICLVGHRGNRFVEWAGSSRANFGWLLELMEVILLEYTKVYSREHGAAKYARALHEWYYSPPPLGEVMSDPPLCEMPASYIVPGDPVASYRNYYRFSKIALARYKNRPWPEWLEGYSSMDHL